MNAEPQHFAIPLRPVVDCAILVLRPVHATEVFDAKLLAILDAPLCAIATPTQGFDRKERLLGNVLAELSREQAETLRSRLSLNWPGDVLARKFNKLAVERRERLKGFLAHCAMTRFTKKTNT